MKSTIKTILSAILVGGQEFDYLMRKYRNPRTPVEMFNDSIMEYYRCTYDGTDFKKDIQPKISEICFIMQFSMMKIYLSMYKKKFLLCHKRIWTKKLIQIFIILLYQK